MNRESSWSHQRRFYGDFLSVNNMPIWTDYLVSITNLFEINFKNPNTIIKESSPAKLIFPTKSKIEVGFIIIFIKMQTQTVVLILKNAAIKGM